MSIEEPTKAERLAEGQARRDEGQQLAREHADSRVLASIDLAIEKAIESGRRFSANTIREQIPGSGQGLVGDRFDTYRKRRVDGHPLMVAVGTTMSDRPTTRHEIKVWLGWDAYQSLQRARVGASA